MTTKRSASKSASQRATFSVVTATTPLTKHISLESGKLVSTSPAGRLQDGKLRIESMSPREFAAMLNLRRLTEINIYGVPKNKRANRVLSKRRFGAATHLPTTITRTVENFEWADEPGIMMIDYDAPEGKTYSKTDLLRLFTKTCKGIACAPVVWKPSASSSIYELLKGKRKRERVGVVNQRVYCFVKSARDIPRAAEVLHKRLWLEGHGYIKISSSGKMLVRSPLDLAVFRSNHIDFTAPATTSKELIASPPLAEVIRPDAQFLDTEQALPDLSTAEHQRYDQLVRSAKELKADEAAQVRGTWRLGQIKKMVDRGVPEKEAARQIDELIDTEVLGPDHVLYPAEGEPVTVADLLAQPDRWHGAHFADPMEPEYRNDSRIAKAFLLPGEPMIKSFAHGESIYYLAPRRIRVTVARGQRDSYLRRVVSGLKGTGNVFNHAGQLVRVNPSGEIEHFTDQTVGRLLSRTFDFVVKRKEGFESIELSAEDIRHLLGGYIEDFSSLTGVVTALVMEPSTGRVMSKPGFDAETGLYVLLPEDIPGVVDRPSYKELSLAFKTIFKPFSSFPYAAPIDQTAIISAVFSAILRPVMETCPLYAFNAPSQGAGKTFMLKAVAALAGGDGTVSAPPQNEEEFKKFLFSDLMSGAPVTSIDNLIGKFDSPTLASILTTEFFKDRVLGASRNAKVATRRLYLASGNQLMFDKDMPRRGIMVTIDPKIPDPTSRQFDFNPYELARKMRHEIAAAVLTIVRAQRQMAPSFSAAGSAPSFDDWNELVRAPIAWAASLQKDGKIDKASDGLMPALGDPIELISQRIQQSPQTVSRGRLLTAIEREFGDGIGRGFTTTMVLAAAASSGISRAVTEDIEENLADVLRELFGANAGNARMIGKYLSDMKGVTLDLEGPVSLQMNGTKQSKVVWYVDRIAPNAQKLGPSLQS